MREQKFELGKIFITKEVAEMIKNDPLQAIFIQNSLYRHASGDWGILTEEDKEENENALKNEERIISSYQSNQKKIWIITEADRSITTILFPEEY